MATVHFGRLSGPAGFARPVAIKRLHENLARDPDFIAMMLDEALVSARVRHPNVVSTLDVVTTDGEFLIVTDYIEGESLSHLLKLSRASAERIPLGVAIAIAVGTLRGLQAAHEATSPDGSPLDLVHRDVSPHNILVGSDGVPRLLDFGVAKATGRLQSTREGQVKGKVAYMPPEQIEGRPVDSRADVYATAVVLWEMIVGERLFAGDSEQATIVRVLSGEVRSPSELRAGVPMALDEIVFRGLSRDRDERFATAREFADALERALAPATASEVGAWVKAIASETLRQRAETLAGIERGDLALGSSGVASAASDDNATRSALADRPVTPAPPPTVKLVSTEPLTPSLPPPKPRRNRRTVALLSGALIAFLGFGAIVVRSLSRNEQASAPPPTALPPSVATPVQAPAPAASEVATAPAMTTREVGPTKNAGVATKPARPPRTAPVGPARPRPNCDPPFFLDATGVKIPKPECR